MNKKIFGTALVAALVAMAWGCSDDDTHDEGEGGEHASQFPSCEAIIEACHLVDTGEGPAHDCHEIAHDDGTEEKCAPKKTECVATCNAAGAALDGGANAADGG